MKYRPLTGREKRFLVYLALLVAGAGFYLWRSRWNPSVTIRTAHFVILSSAPTNQAWEIARTSESLYAAYTNLLGARVPLLAKHPPLRMKLYHDREEFRRCAHVFGYAEAYYRKPYCHAYYDETGPNAYHWMLHEVTHQLSAEVAQLDLAQWLDEGLADYFGSSLLPHGVLSPGTVDVNTYPVWWIESIATSGVLEADLRNGSVIPLRALITGRGGPSLNQKLNLYYLEWWTLVHFLFDGEDGRYREGAMQVLRAGGSLSSFEKHIGPVEGIQPRWYASVGHLKRALEGRDLRALYQLQHLDRHP